MQHYAGNNLTNALKDIEHNKILKEDYNKVLLAMEKGRLLYLNNQPKEACDLLIEAEYRLEDWNTFYKRTLTGNKKIVSDQRYTKNGEPLPDANSNSLQQNTRVRGYVSSTTVPTFKALYKTEYLGTEIERPMVNYVIGLCGVKLKDDKPLTEAKRLTMLQDQLNIRKSPISNFVPYTPNPFIDMCTAFFYEQMMANNDAFIAYERAYKAFKEPNCFNNYGINMPVQLLPKLIKLSELLGFADRTDWYQKEWAKKETLTETNNTIILLEFNMAPRKYNKIIEVPLPDNTITTCNYPFVNAISYPVNKINVSTQKQTTVADIIFDINHTMVEVGAKETKNEMDERIRNGITSRTENNKTKYSLSADVSRRNYDTRSWQSLPLQIAYSYVNLTEGVNEITISYKTKGKTVVKSLKVNYTKGDKIIPIRIMD